jgi:hypothetical protein
MHGLPISKSLNARILQDRRQQMEKTKEKLYEEQLLKMWREIDVASQSPTAKDRIMFSVPFTINGEPFYDFEECKKYLKNKMRERGFYCKLMIPGNILFVSWNPKLTGELPAQNENTQESNKETVIEVELDRNDPRWQHFFGSEFGNLRKRP